MSEPSLDVRHLPKREAYAALDGHVRAVLAGVDDDVTRMATIACILHQGLGHLWTGFYRLVRPELLRVGPYQGTLGCLEIPLGRGVCGAAAARRETIVVPDVHAFPGHIACDGRSRSEIVVPVFGPGAARPLLGVLDLDSTELGAFDEEDARGLAALLTVFAE